MIDPKLIILYGDFSDKENWKVQRNIDGGATCGYNEMAERFGYICYLRPVKISKKHELKFTLPAYLYQFLMKFPDAIIWSVKKGEKKDAILKAIPHKKIYYSCCNYNRVNLNCDISLVDTTERLSGKYTALHVKGKNPEYWNYAGNDRVYDYIMCSSRGDKNEAYFIKQLTEKVPEKRSILWIGGQKHSNSVIKSHHSIFLTPFQGKDAVRDYMAKSKVGVILSDIQAEGFPQSFLEMTMMGCPVAYMGPNNPRYFNKYNSAVTNKESCIADAERLLSSRDAVKCREFAVNNYSLDRSFENMRRVLNVK